MAYLDSQEKGKEMNEQVHIDLMVHWEMENLCLLCKLNGHMMRFEGKCYLVRWPYTELN